MSRNRRRIRRRRQCSRKTLDSNMITKVLESMKKIAVENNGLLPLLKTSSALVKTVPMLSMIRDDLVRKSSKTKCDVVALDCEMVGVGCNQSALGRCSIVDYNGSVIYDSYVRPPVPVTNYRKRWSGIMPHHMKSAQPFDRASEEIKRIVADKIVVGHDILNDFKAINMTHPQDLIRDTSHLKILLLPNSQTPSLKLMAKILFNRDIQKESHCSIEDAQTCLSIYKLFEDSWENNLAYINYDDYFSDMLPLTTEHSGSESVLSSSNVHSNSSSSRPVTAKCTTSTPNSSLPNSFHLNTLSRTPHHKPREI